MASAISAKLTSSMTFSAWSGKNCPELTKRSMTFSIHLNANRANANAIHMIRGLGFRLQATNAMSATARENNNTTMRVMKSNCRASFVSVRRGLVMTSTHPAWAAGVMRARAVRNRMVARK